MRAYGFGFLFACLSPLLQVSLGFPGIASANPQTSPPAATVTSIDPKTSLVTARINATGQVFQFTLANSALLARLRPGQGVYVNLGKRQISLDGKSIAGAIVSMQQAPDSLSAASPPAASSRQEGIPALTPPPSSGSVRGVPLSGTPPASASDPSTAPAPPSTLSVKLQIFQPPPLGRTSGIPGGEQVFGTVTLTGSVGMRLPPRISLRLSSSRPDVANVPSEIAVEGLNAPVRFPIKTVPVTVPSDILISAQLANSSNTSMANLTVRPPELAGIDCSPRQFAGGDKGQCKVWLDGKLAGIQMIGSRGPQGNPVSIGIATSNPQVANYSPGAVQISPGQSAAQFELSTTPYPDTFAVTLSASYGGSQKSVDLTVVHTAIASFLCKFDGYDYYTDNCRHVAWPLSNPESRHLSVKVTLTAPAPSPNGYQIRIGSDSHLLGVTDNGEMVVPWGWTESRPYGFYETAVSKETKVTLTAQDPLSGEGKPLVVFLEPPDVSNLSFDVPVPAGSFFPTISNVPANGKQVMATVTLNGVAPDGGISFDVRYTWLDSNGTLPSSNIQGPLSIKIPGGSYRHGFQFTVPPCALNPPCYVYVFVGYLELTIEVIP